MLSFKSYTSKNKHLEHIEDMILIDGIAGANAAINTLESIVDMLNGHTKASFSISTKWDGAPSIYAGTDPSDGRFFVAKKSIFNKNPKVYKSNTDIDADLTGNLNTKFKLALAEFPKLDIKGVVQGDFLYAKKDVYEVVIDEKSYIAFHPNTIVYTIPKHSDIADKIRASRIGVVWHTAYRGSSFETMSATFGAEIASSLKKVNTVWSIDAKINDTTTLPLDEYERIGHILNVAKRALQDLNDIPISANPDLIIRIQARINAAIKNGDRIQDVKALASDIAGYYDAEVNKRTSVKGKASWTSKRDDALLHLNKTDLIKLFDLYNLIVYAKDLIIKHLDKAKTVGTYLKTNDGYKVTEQEGYVVIDHTGKNAVKLVNRLRFSRANFAPDINKGWQK